MTPAVRILDEEAFAELSGLRYQIRDRATKKTVLDLHLKEEVFRETGELFLIERVFNRQRDIYFVRYTNLTTGEIKVELEEPVSEHQGYGAAKKKP